MKPSVDQLLSRAIAEHKKGELQKAEYLYRSILNINKVHPDANHNLGVLAIAVGESEAAIPFLKVAIETNPRKEQYWVSCITALIKLQRFDDAKKIMRKAIALGLQEEKFNSFRDIFLNDTKRSILSNEQITKLVRLYEKNKISAAILYARRLLVEFPGSHIITNLLGAIYFAKDDYEYAIRKIKYSLKIKPDFPEALNNLGNSLIRIKKYEDTLIYYTHAIILRPNFTSAYYNLGIALYNLGRYEECILYFNQAVNIQPKLTDAYLNLGAAFNSIGKYDMAIYHLRRAIDLKPNHSEALNNLGNVLRNQGHLTEAISCFNKAIVFKPNSVEAYTNLAAVLSVYRSEFYSINIASSYINVLDINTLTRPHALVTGSIALLKHHRIMKEIIDFENNEDLESLVTNLCASLDKIPLFLKLLKLCPIHDLQIEAAMVKIRKVLLLNRHFFSQYTRLLHFQEALALQSFTNEYIFDETQEETASINELEDHILKCFSSKKDPSTYDIACLASYRPLHNYNWAEALVNQTSLGSIITRQVIDIKKEINLGKSIRRLGSIKNLVSRSVKEQYEENPYPRWVSTSLERKPNTILEIVVKLGLLPTRKIDHLSECPEILIAGCGTGQHALASATRFSNSHITAIDLSLSSLSYAQRKTDEFNIKNIEYIQADILELGVLGKQFDIVESSGVLHHMEDPIKGWNILTNCLKPGGLMKIGLYSELGRKDVAYIRGKILQKKIRAETTSMLKFRKEIIHSDDPLLKSLTQSGDFYSLSTLRDLLFHTQEHHFTLPKIDVILKELGLNFIGFEFSSKDEINSFKNKYTENNAPYNLEYWHRFETSNQQLFRGMYQFWVQKL